MFGIWIEVTEILSLCFRVHWAIFKMCWNSFQDLKHIHVYTCTYSHMVRCIHTHIYICMYAHRYTHTLILTFSMNVHVYMQTKHSLWMYYLLLKVWIWFFAFKYTLWIFLKPITSASTFSIFKNGKRPISQE